MLELKNSRAEPMLKWPSPYIDSFIHMQMRGGVGLGSKVGGGGDCKWEVLRS